MSSKKQDFVLIGAGAAACAVCCAAPILGLLAAIGLGTVLGVAVFGVVGLSMAAIGIIFLNISILLGAIARLFKFKLLVCARVIR